MRKWPKEWVSFIAKISSVSTDPWVVLDDMNAIGMLAPIPEPLEIDYCTEHKSRRYDGPIIGNLHMCFSLYANQSDGECRFIKMREVTE